MVQTRSQGHFSSIIRREVVNARMLGKVLMGICTENMEYPLLAYETPVRWTGEYMQTLKTITFTFSGPVACLYRLDILRVSICSLITNRILGEVMLREYRHAGYITVTDVPVTLVRHITVVKGFRFMECVISWEDK